MSIKYDWRDAKSARDASSVPMSWSRITGPALLSRLGLGYEVMSEINPRMIYCSISAFGQDEPRGGQTAYDHVIQGTPGLMATTGTEEVNPIKLGSPAVDYATGTMAAFALADALLQGERTLSGSTWQCLMSQ